ncbi:GSCOCG00011835001-RA-CDS, partial [Cotesia congregata]
QILTLFPKEWSVRRISEFMNISRHLVNVAKNLLETKVLLSKPESKLGRSLSDELKSKIINFYNDDECSVNMPGMKDCISVRNDDGKLEPVQKRLILSNLKESYQKYRENYSEDKIGFSKYASLRPKYCVLAGSSG